MKTVLFLINGFGIEHKNSYSIYNQNLMPNFDKLMKNYMFQTLDSKVNNYQEGYRNISLDINEIYNYTLVNDAINSGNLLNNNVIICMQKHLEANKKLHFFCLIDKSIKVVENLKYVLKIINPNKDQKIFFHLVLTSNNVEDYKEILEVLSKINIELNEYGQIGMIMGLGTISNDNPIPELNFFFRTLISETGERWQSFKQKLDVCYGIKQSPNLVKPFIVNKGFNLEKNDMFMIWNYDRIDLTNFINTVKQIKYGEEKNNIVLNTLFEINYPEKIPYILNYQIAKDSLANNIKGLNFKSLVLANKKQINIINYYLNGLQNISNPNINYIEFDNYLYKSKELLGIINNYDHELIIINYNIDDVKNIAELKEQLHNIDIMLGNVYENSKTSNYSIIVSSLYGINKVLENDKGEICNIIYNGKIPIVYIDSFITKKNYLIEDGTINDIFKICYKNINKNYLGHSIVTKKNVLYRMFFK